MELKDLQKMLSLEAYNLIIRTIDEDVKMKSKLSSASNIIIKLEELAKDLNTLSSDIDLKASELNDVLDDNNVSDLPDVIDRFVHDIRYFSGDLDDYVSSLYDLIETIKETNSEEDLD